MKKITLLLIALCLAIHIKAQGETLKELVAEGNKAYVEFVDVKKIFRKPKRLFTIY